MALSAGEMLRSNHASDLDGRTVVVNPDGTTIAGGGTPAYQGTPGSAPPSKAIWIAGTDGSLLRALATDVNGILKADIAGVDAGVTVPVKVLVATSATLSNVASSASSTSLLASNANRRGMTIFNDSTAILYVKFGATASATSYTVQVAAGGYYEMPSPIYTGAVDGIWAAANGNARITELA